MTFFTLFELTGKRKFNIYTTQPGNLFLHSITIFYQACKVCHFTKHVKHAILVRTQGKPFFEARQAGHFINHSKQAIVC